MRILHEVIVHHFLAAAERHPKVVCFDIFFMSHNDDEFSLMSDYIKFARNTLKPQCAVVLRFRLYSENLSGGSGKSAPLCTAQTE